MVVKEISKMDTKQIAKEMANNPDESTRAYLLLRSGILYSEQEKYDLALNAFCEAKELFVKQDKLAEVSKVFNNIALIYIRLGRRSQAMESLKRSMKIKEESGATHSVDYANSLNNLAILFFENSELEKARELFLRAATILEKLDPVSANYANTLCNVGVLSLKMKDFGTALDYFRRSARIYTEAAAKSKNSNDRRSLSNLYNLKGKVLSEMRDYDQALKSVRRGFELAEESGFSLRKRESVDLLSHIYEQMGDYKKALKYARQFEEMCDEVFNESVRKELAATEAKFKTDNLLNQIARQRQLEAELKKQNLEMRKLTQAIEQSANSVVITDVDGRIEYVNPRFEETTGYTREEAIGQNPRILKSDHFDAEVYEDLWKTISSGKEWSGEFQNKRKDGSLYWERATIAPVIDDSGDIINFIAVKEDITDLKNTMQRLQHTLKDREMLLREIHHRIKNNLAIVSGLLSLQAMDIEDERLLTKLEESQMRIRAIATVHEKLYRSRNLKYVDYREYLRSLVEEIARIHSNAEKTIDFDLQIQEIYSVPDTAVTCGLIITELLTNSLKHAFPGRDQGRIQIIAEVSGDTMRIVIQDNGKGMAENYDISASDSLGMQLVDSMVSKINGDLKITSRGGTAFQITFNRLEHNILLPDEIQVPEGTVSV